MTWMTHRCFNCLLIFHTLIQDEFEGLLPEEDMEVSVPGSAGQWLAANNVTVGATAAHPRHLVFGTDTVYVSLQVPGNYFDAVTSTTKLGKAVKAAVQELEHLGNLVSGAGPHTKQLYQKKCSWLAFCRYTDAVTFVCLLMPDHYIMLHSDYYPVL
jgi:hypothetical protein